MGATALLAQNHAGDGKPYQSRDPLVCKSQKEPAKGAPSGSQLKEYVQCSNEKTAGGYISLFQNLEAEIGKSRPYSAWSDSGYTSIDNSQPVYPIRGSYGSYDLYSCRSPGSMGFPAGKNCASSEEFVGNLGARTSPDSSQPLARTCPSDC
jgi:hypothetical protein